LIESKVADETKEPKKRGRKKKLILMVPAPLSESETTDDAEEEMDEEDVSEVGSAFLTLISFTFSTSL